MKKTTDQLIREQLLRMGEDPNSITNAEESEVATLVDRLRIDLEPALVKEILSTPRDRLTGWRLLDDAGIRTMEDGSVRLPLPDDFLLLYCVRLKGWERAVTEITPADSIDAHLQGARWPGLRASAQRPLAVMEPYGDEGRAIRLYGTHSDPPALAEGWYLPLPIV